MLLSFILRLRPDQLLAGALVGEVEDVDSAQTHAIRDADDLVEFCRRRVPPAPEAGQSEGARL